MNFEACIECSLTKLWGSGYNLKGKILKLCLNWVLNFSRLIANSTFYWGYFPVIYMSLSRSSVSTEDIHVKWYCPFFSFRLFLIFSIEFVRDSFIYFPGFFKGWLRIQISRGSFLFYFSVCSFPGQRQKPL